MISRIIKKAVELSKVQKVDQLEGPLYQLENGGHTFEITCLMDGEAASVSGTVSARFLRQDEVTVYFTGTLSGNVASITLPQSCYNVNGRFGLVVFVAGNDVTTAVYAVAGSVYRSTSEHIIDPTEEIPSLEDLIAKIQDCEDATEAAEAAAAFVPNVIAPAYSASATYSVGDYVTKDGYMYRCNTAISTAEAWTAAHWTQVTAGAELDDLKSAFSKSFYYPTLTSADVVDDYYINGGNGYPISLSGYKCTDFISIKDALDNSALISRVTFANAGGYAFYNASKQYISGESGTSRGISSTTKLEVLTIPENAEYFRTSLLASAYSTPGDFMIGFENFNQLRAEEDKKIKLINSTVNNGRQTFALFSNFQRAGLNVNGTLKIDQPYRVSCSDHIIFANDVTVSVQSGYQWGYIPFVNGSAGSWSGWKSTDYTIPANTEFVVQIMHSPEQTSVPADVDAFVGAITFNTVAGNLNDVLYQGYLAYHGTIVSRTNEYPYARGKSIFSADSIVFKTDGTAYCGLSFDFKLPNIGQVIHIHSERNTGNNWKIRAICYDSSNNILSNINTSKDDLYCVVPENTVLLTVTIAACWLTALEEGTNVTFSNVRFTYQDADGTGINIYTGKNISLVNDNPKINKCSITLWKDFTNVSSYSLHLNEAMAIYNGYVFLFNGGGGGIVVDYSTKNILSEFTTAPTENNHQNSAQFTNIYHTAGDEFPLLLIARCGNTNGTTSGYDECLVYRVTRSGTNFTFTLVNSIVFDKRTYGTSWGIDNATGTLYVTSTVNGNWSVTTNNPLNWWAFNMPSKESILSGTAITLTESDAIAHAEADFAVQQGCCVNHGLMFEAVQQLNGTAIKDSMIYAVDVFKNQIVSKIPLLIADEPEGVDVYNGKLYVTQKKGSDTSGNNPLKIYEIEF